MRTDEVQPGAGSTQWWGARSELDPLAAVLDPSPGAQARNAQIDRLHRLALRRALAGRRLGRVLDFGCGTGRLSAEVLPLADAVTGVDISEKMTERARELVPGAQFVAYDGERLPFRDAAFDTAVSALVLQMYADDPPRFGEIAGDLARVVRRDGELWLIERCAPEGEPGWTPDRWGAELGRAGFALRSVRPVRAGGSSLLFHAVARGWVPRPALGAVAAADVALAGRLGVRAPYTECLMRAVRR